MDSLERKKVKEFLGTFMYLNKYSWPVLRHELIFLLIVYIFEGGFHGTKASIVCHVLKRSDEITQSDRNKTWYAGKRLVEKGYLIKPKRGYYTTTILGKNQANILGKDLNNHFTNFRLFHL